MKMTGKRPIHMAFISDIHLGHRRTKTEDIIKGLDAAFPMNDDTAALDIVFIVGDVFDTILTLPSAEAVQIKLWMYNFLFMCHRYDIVLVVLEGTPSHDRGQSAEFIRIQQIMTHPVECYYQNTLSILHLDKWDIDILCIPDECRNTHDLIWSDTQKLLYQHNIEKVDITLMHGMFEYQVPKGVMLSAHKEDNYLGITRAYISIGHFHVYSRYARIFAQGSFDRLAQGEEQPKGYVRIVLNGEYASDKDTFVFIPNTMAKLYKTYNVTTDNITDVITQAAKLPIDSYICFKTEKDATELQSLTAFKRVSTEYHVTIKTERSKTESTLKEFIYTTDNLSLTPKVLPGVLIDRLIAQEVDITTIDSAREMLETATEVLK